MNGQRPLPWCAGPKLDAFPLQGSANSEVEIIDHIGKGAHAEVFRVKIRGEYYALKVFRFYRAKQLVARGILEDGLAEVQDVINHNDPFHCECRAYGRLKEVNREDLAVRAYGYLLLDSTVEEKLAERGFQDWLRYDSVKQHPLRSIVKELLPTDLMTPAFDARMLPQMRRDLQDLHAYGIVVWDLRSDNYMGGRIIDFSQAKTVPHFELSWDANPVSRETAIEACAGDYSGFDVMALEWNDEHPDQAFWNVFLPNEDYGRRLRSHSRRRTALMHQEGVRLDAIFYDWKNKQPWVVKIDTAATERLQKRAVSSKNRNEDDEIVVIKRRRRGVQKKSPRRRKGTS